MYSDLVEIGKGGMGRIYKAKQDSLNRDVAIKVMHFPDDDEGVQHHINLYVSIAPYPARNAQQKNTSAVVVVEDVGEDVVVGARDDVPEEKRRSI